MRGPRPTATDEQRERVLELVAAGETQRKTAELVFGDARLHGRVQRILRRVRFREQEEPHGSPATVEELYDRYWRDLDRRLAAGEKVSARELSELAKLEARIGNRRTLERLNAMTRSA